MSAGAEGAAAQRHEEEWHHEETAEAPPVLEAEWTPEAEAAPLPRERGRPVLAGLLILLAIGWLAVSGLVLYRTWPTADLVSIVSWVATISVPLALLALLWLAFGRTSRAETEKFTHAVAEMRRESEALERVLAVVAQQLGTNRMQLSEEAARLMQLGEEASDRLGRVTHYLSREAEGLNAKSQALEAAAAQARVDIGVLLTDLPQAEESAKSFSETLREAGMSAHERARALEAQLSAIAARAQDADAATGGAAERLSAHIARIESSANVATRQLEGAATQLDSTIDGALGRTSEAVEATRVALNAQNEGLLASIEQSRARFAEAGAEADRLLSERMAAIEAALAGLSERVLSTIDEGREHIAAAGSDAGTDIAARLEEARLQVERIGTGIAAQEQAGEELVARLSSHVASLDERLAALGQRADGQSTQIATALAELRDATATLRQEVDASTQEAAAMVSRAHDMAGALDNVGARLRDELPPVLADVEARTAAMREAALSAIEPVQAIQAAATDGAAQLAQSEESVARQRAELEAVVAGLNDGLATVMRRLGELTSLAIETDHSLGVIVRDAGPELVETLVRVRDTSRAAAAHAREAITAVIPQSAASLSEAAKQALGDSITSAVQDQMSELETSAQRAAAAARNASERLTRQLMALGEGAAALEAKIAEERAQRDEQEREALPRRVALLIESLNSTAIDVTKILSNEVTDSAWQAYLKGDRGVFTRRAVRLLDSGEAREIQRHYDQEPEFREQVNRYIADFEAMLRRVLADGEGNARAITLLSSDMGKLYVALAQAIQHLRV